MLKHILTIFLPAALVYCAFRLGGIVPGIIAFGIYICAALFIKLPDLLMIRGVKQHGKDTEKGLATMEKALQTKRLRPEYILYYGFMCLKNGETERAERILDAAAHKKMSPQTQMRAAVNRALLLWKKGNIEKAISILEEQLKEGKDKAVYGTLGQLLILNGQLQHALEINRDAYAFDKYDDAICDNLALNLRLCGDLDSSYAMYKELTDKKLGVPIPYYNCGETLYAMGKKEEAIEMMERALLYPFSKLAAISRAEIESRIEEIRTELSAE